MAIQLHSPPLTRHHFNVTEYDAMIRAGVFAEDDRVELLEGEIVEMSPIGPDHAGIVNRLNRLFTQRLGVRALVAVQNPLHLAPASEPQPDVMLLRPRPDDYRRSHPVAADVLLLIEVADTTLAIDRHTKLPVYARAGVDEVWIVNLPEMRVEVYRAPHGEAYQEQRALNLGEILAPLAFPEDAVDTGEILL